MNIGTPQRISPKIREMSLELTGDNSPTFVPVKALPGADALECFPVVENHVAQAGGTVCYGWRFWELPGIYVEAEFHAVWRTEDGSLLDITPNQVGSQQVLFVADPSRVYEGHQVKNIRRALADHPAILNFFAAADAEYEFMNRGSRADQHGQIVLSPAESREYMQIQTKKADAMSRMMRKGAEPVRSPAKVGRNEPCPCGSGRKFKKCCGR